MAKLHRDKTETVEKRSRRTSWSYITTDSPNHLKRKKKRRQMNETTTRSPVRLFSAGLKRSRVEPRSHHVKGTDVEGGSHICPQHSPQHPFSPAPSAARVRFLQPCGHVGFLKDRPLHLLWWEANSEMALGAFREGVFWSVWRGNYANDAGAVISRDHSGAAAPALFL